MNYKLLPNFDGIERHNDDNTKTTIPNSSNGWTEYQEWLAEDNIPLPADQLTVEELAKQVEVNQSHSIAKTWFSGQAAAIAFVRQTPEQQATQISGMTVAQKDTVLKYLAIAVSMLIKERLL